MCLGTPKRIESRDAIIARCEARGSRHDVGFFLRQGEDSGPGDRVTVHVGYAILKMAEADAPSPRELFGESEALDARQTAAVAHA